MSTSCTSSWHTTWHSSHVRHASWSSSSLLVELGDDGVAHSLHLLLLVLELLHLGELVGIQPLDGLVTLVSDLLLVVLADLVGDLLVLDGSLHVEAVALQAVLGRDPLLLLVVVILELLGVVHHPLNLFLGQTTLVVGDGDLVLLGGDGGVPLDERGHHTSSSLDTQRQRSNIQEQQVRHSLGGVSSEDGGLHSGSIGHSLVRVDALVQLLAIEEVLQQLLDLGDSSGSSNQDNVIDGALVHLGVSHGLLQGYRVPLNKSE